MNSSWQRIGAFILRQRIPLLVLLGLITVFMWTVRGTEMVHEISKVIMSNKEEMEAYTRFRSSFGDDGNVIVVAIQGDIFQYDLFTGIYDLCNELDTAYGVTGVVALPRLFDVVRNDSLESFDLRRLSQGRPGSQAGVDSIRQRLQQLVFYRNLLYNETSNTTLLAVSVDDSLLNTAKKIDLVNAVRGPVKRFKERYQVETHLSGLPVIRVFGHETVKDELYLFLALALSVTAITLALFFRSIYTVIFPLMVVGAVIIFSLGLLGLFGFLINLLTGVIPALVTVITIPNCVYLITKYHIEFRRTGNKMKALITVIDKIGIVTVMTNATTAIGLGVLAFTDIDALREFGIVGGLSVVAAFFISLLFIPIVFSFLPPPTTGQTRHLERKSLSFVIKTLDHWVLRRTNTVFVVAAILAAVSLYGMSLVKPVSYMVDDVPMDSDLMKDLRFVEGQFNGALPFEILIDTKSRNGVLNRKTLLKIQQLQDSLATYQDISRSLSVADLAKFFNQSFFGGDSTFYELPGRNQTPMIRSFLAKSDLLNSAAISKSLVDTSLSITRVSASVRDIGSLEMQLLVDSVRKDVADIFEAEEYETAVTGTTQVFIQANKALIENLLTSLALAFVVIAILMGLLFRSPRIVLASIIPNALPLIMVAGIMGFAGIALKPSTALVFGVAFGIAVDDSIHFLARYRLARRHGDSVRDAISNSFKDTGISMIYTSLILFFGFICFLASDFGGTQALGLLTSLTLIIAMFSNLLFLPALVLVLDKDVPPPSLLDEDDDETLFSA